MQRYSSIIWLAVAICVGIASTSAWGPQFSDAERYRLIKAFLDRHIKQVKP